MTGEHSVNYDECTVSMMTPQFLVASLLSNILTRILYHHRENNNANYKPEVLQSLLSGCKYKVLIFFFLKNNNYWLQYIICCLVQDMHLHFFKLGCGKKVSTTVDIHRQNQTCRCTCAHNFIFCVPLFMEVVYPFFRVSNCTSSSDHFQFPCHLGSNILSSSSRVELVHAALS